jgi:3-hydroxyacyl-[acyl-carrier-protein] dehydratase
MTIDTPHSRCHDVLRYAARIQGIDLALSAANSMVAPLFRGASRCMVEFITRAWRATGRVGKTLTDPLGLDISAILGRLPHRHPFLLVDRVLEIHPGQSIRALKNVTYNEPFFTGHFPFRPLMPGVIVIEALAQTAGILSFVTSGMLPDETTRFYLVGLDKARFRKPVVPGDQLLLCAQLERSVQATLHFSTRALVGDNEVASAEMMIAQTADN